MVSYLTHVNEKIVASSHFELSWFYVALLLLILPQMLTYMTRLLTTCPRKYREIDSDLLK